MASVFVLAAHHAPLPAQAIVIDAGTMTDVSRWHPGRCSCVLLSGLEGAPCLPIGTAGQVVPEDRSRNSSTTPAGAMLPFRRATPPRADK